MVIYDLDRKAFSRQIYILYRGFDILVRKPFFLNLFLYWIHSFTWLDTGKPVIQQRANTSVISTNELRNIREQIEASKFNKSMASVVGKGDLERVKTFSIVKDKAQIESEKLIANEQRTKRMAVSIARKNRMKT